MRQDLINFLRNMNIGLLLFEEVQEVVEIVREEEEEAIQEKVEELIS